MKGQQGVWLLLLEVFFFLCFFCSSFVLSDELVTISNSKDYKKILKTKSNVLAFFSKDSDFSSQVLPELDQAAKEIKGKGTIIFVDCVENKKNCKVLSKKERNRPYIFKHFEEGKFKQEYNRPFKTKSFVNFLQNPNSEAPWEEDPRAADIKHVTDDDFDRIVLESKKPTLVMFYAPWCGHCKLLKPEYAAAATELKNKKAQLVAIDSNAPNGRISAMRYNVTGYPSLKYFENGEYKFDYGGSRKKQDIIDWLSNPQPPPPPPAPEPEWEEVESEVVHLTSETFDSFVKENPSALVMFYAPWCGHCKRAKPEYQEAAQLLKDMEIEGKLCAVDATKNSDLASRFDVKGYPTFLYMKDGENAFQYSGDRKKEAFVEFMKNPEEPPAEPESPPEPEPEWEEIAPEIHHLTDETFEKFVKKKKHVLVMFYAPWCGHCKAFKPAFQEAARELANQKKANLAAVDCTKHTQIASKYEIRGYPTIQYFSLGKLVQDYDKPRTKEGIIEFFQEKLPDKLKRDNNSE